MMDIVLLVVVVAFFVMAALLVVVIDRMIVGVGADTGEGYDEDADAAGELEPERRG